MTDFFDTDPAGVEAHPEAFEAASQAAAGRFSAAAGWDPSSRADARVLTAVVAAADAMSHLLAMNTAIDDVRGELHERFTFCANTVTERGHKVSRTESGPKSFHR